MCVCEGVRAFLYVEKKCSQPFCKPSVSMSHFLAYMQYSIRIPTYAFSTMFFSFPYFEDKYNSPFFQIRVDPMLVMPISLILSTRRQILPLVLRTHFNALLKASLSHPLVILPVLLIEK
jgi:hypothetical protein